MEIRYTTGDATRPVGDGVKIIVHICNDIGGWGAGFVVAISRRWPEPEQQYRAWHAGAGEVPFELGQVQFVNVEPDLWVANLVGQHGLKRQHGAPPIRYEAVRAGLRRVAERARELGASIHMPRIGCGLAGGDWAQVSCIIQEELANGGIPVTVYDLGR